MQLNNNFILFDADLEGKVFITPWLIFAADFSLDAQGNPVINGCPNIFSQKFLFECVRCFKLNGIFS